MSEHGAKKKTTKRATKKSVIKTRTVSPRDRSTTQRGKGSKTSVSVEQGAWSGARAEQHRLKRDAILRVASRLINRKGYAGTSLTDIASALQIRNASLYHYFDSKEELIFACFERAQKIVGDTLDSVDLSGRSGLEAIELYVVAIRGRMRQDGELPMTANVWFLEKTHKRAIVSAELEQLRRIGEFIERGIEDGSIRRCNVSLTRTMLFAALRSVPAHYLRVKPEVWPELDREVLIAVRHLLAR